MADPRLEELATEIRAMIVRAEAYKIRAEAAESQVVVLQEKAAALQDALAEARKDRDYWCEAQTRAMAQIAEARKERDELEYEHGRAKDEIKFWAGRASTLRAALEEAGITEDDTARLREIATACENVDQLKSTGSGREFFQRDANYLRRLARRLVVLSETGQGDT